MIRLSTHLALFAALFAPVSLDAADDWAEQMVRAFSNRITDIEAELEALDAELPGLPRVPIDDQGGTGGFAMYHSQVEPEERKDYAMTLPYASDQPVDLVVLVPARRYGVNGLQPQLGTPDAFTVELIDERGEVLQVVAQEKDVSVQPVRGGHPFVYPVSPPVVASGLRIKAQRLNPDEDNPNRFIHAWSEVFVYAGDHNLAAGQKVKAGLGARPTASWHWNEAFLTDGQTPLGLPEMPGEPHRDVGWISNAKQRADDASWLEIDLGKAGSCDSLHLFPSKRPTSDLPSGFGFPRKLKIGVSDQPSRRDQSPDFKIERFIDLPNPGHNPVKIAIGGAKGRYVRIEATELWKEFEGYPAFFALSEVEVIGGGENLARGAKVRSPDGMGNVVAAGSQYWGTKSLTDGFGPEGKLVPRREWLIALGKRADLETRRYHLKAEAQEIVSNWRRGALIVITIAGVVGVFGLIFTPLRYRVQQRRELKKVRERIASDLHDEVGSNLGSIQMFADLAEGRSGPSEELKRIQRIAAETVSAVRDIVWLLRPGKDHRIGTSEHLRETASIMLEPLDWLFTANEAAWQTELSDEQNRHLFLFFREALHNILRHASAQSVKIEASQDEKSYRLVVRDDGCGIAEKKMARKSTLRALHQRVEALEAEMKVTTASGEGTTLELSIPLGG